MVVSVKRQEGYSRGALLLRTFFGWLYISIPHFFLLFFVSIWGAVLGFVAWWAVLFTGKYPKSFHEFQVGLLDWGVRVHSALLNLTDEYPSFGTKGTSDSVKVELPCPESSSRGLLIVRLLFGLFYIWIPHGVLLFFRFIGAAVIAFLAWWVVLFTGSYPENMHNYQVGTLRWLNRVGAYSSILTDTYPPFSGKE